MLHGKKMRRGRRTGRVLGPRTWRRTRTSPTPTRPMSPSDNPFHPWLLGMRTAMEMLLTGDAISGTEAAAGLRQPRRARRRARRVLRAALWDQEAGRPGGP